ISLGILLWLLSLSLSSEQGFESARAITDSFFVKLILWGMLTALAYHVVGGIRHLLADMGYGEESLVAASRTAKIAFIITAVLSLLAGVLVW
ncbi:MAG: succinate dehydrogenase, cytochrome b556 subunit, partial [Plesiomonas sp.]